MDYFMGIDVSKKTLDLAVLKEGTLVWEQQVENSRKALLGALRLLKQQYSILAANLTVCMEYTGIYNSIALDVFYQNNIKVCLERALHIKQSQGLVRGKNDKIDARRIASYAWRNHQELSWWKPQRENIQRLQALLVLRERLIRVKKQLHVPLQEAVEFVKSSIAKQLSKANHHTLQGLDKDISLVEHQIEELIEQDAQIKKRMEQITSIPGVGPITALNVIITTQEFTKISESKKFACYAGVAPFEHTSGSSIRGKTHVSKLANMTMKTLLHLAAMVAIQHNPELKLFYQRKVEAGKNKMSVINAVRNKLISRIFACVNNDRKYQKNYQHALA